MSATRRRLRLVAVLLFVAATVGRAEGQTPISGAPPQPLELEPGTVPASPLPSPFVPPGAGGAAPAEGVYAVPTGILPAPTTSQPTTDYGGQPLAASAALGDEPPEISPNHPEKWRYVYRNGGWWYYTPTKRWMYWSGGRWVQYAPPAVSNTSAAVQPPGYSRPRLRFGVGVGVGAGYYPYGPSPYGSYPYGGYPR